MPNWAAVHGRLERACLEPGTSKQLRVSVLDLLRPVVPTTPNVWLLTDPVTRVGTVPLAHIPGLPWAELPALVVVSRTLLPGLTPLRLGTNGAVGDALASAVEGSRP